jgi:AraC-like DNA-binding protein
LNHHESLIPTLTFADIANLLFFVMGQSFSVTSYPRSRIHSMRCLRSAPGAFCDYHSHPFPEFTLVTDDSTMNGCAEGKLTSLPNTLYLFLPGEQHGHWNSSRQRPRFWVIHFTSPLCHQLAYLSEPNAALRIWHLTPEQTSTFKWLFIKLFNEHTQLLANNDVGAEAWLQLLLVNLGRWVENENGQQLLPEQPDADVLQLWHVVNECVGRSHEFVHQIGQVPNYDSVRHRFKNVFGVSPTQLLFRLRMQKASDLLLETPMTIKEIADQLGYERQHEFARAFRKHTGRTPSGWRTEPFPEDLSFSSNAAT